MVENFRKHDPGKKFDVLHFHDWHPPQALHLLETGILSLPSDSTEYGRSGNHFGDWWEFKKIFRKGIVRGAHDKTGNPISETLKKEVINLYNVPRECWKCDVVPNGIVPRQRALLQGKLHDG